VTPSGIQQATLKFVAQYLNQLLHRVPQRQSKLGSNRIKGRCIYFWYNEELLLEALCASVEDVAVFVRAVVLHVVHIFPAYDRAQATRSCNI
jgi:hypothetical protein